MLITYSSQARKGAYFTENALYMKPLFFGVDRRLFFLLL